MGRARLIFLAVLAAISVACGWLAYQAPVRAQAETTILGDLISRALSTPKKSDPCSRILAMPSSMRLRGRAPQ